MARQELIWNTKMRMEKPRLRFTASNASLVPATTKSEVCSPVSDLLSLASQNIGRPLARAGGVWRFPQLLLLKQRWAESFCSPLAGAKRPMRRSPRTRRRGSAGTFCCHNRFQTDRIQTHRTGGLFHPPFAKYLSEIFTWWHSPPSCTLPTPQSLMVDLRGIIHER